MVQIIQLGNDSLIALEIDAFVALHDWDASFNLFNNFRCLKLMKFEHKAANDHEKEANNDSEQADK